jgi:predicted membrane protein
MYWGMMMAISFSVFLILAGVILMFEGRRMMKRERRAEQDANP